MTDFRDGVNPRPGRDPSQVAPSTDITRQTDAAAYAKVPEGLNATASSRPLDALDPERAENKSWRPQNPGLKCMREAARTAKLSIHGKNAPFSGNAFERMLALIDEQQPGSRDKVSHRARHEYLPGARERRHASTDMNRYPPDVVVDLFALARVKACTNIKPDRAHFIDDCARASDRAGRAVERNEKAVARRICLTAAKPAYVASDHGVMLVEQVTPALVAYGHGLFCRLDDICE